MRHAEVTYRLTSVDASDIDDLASDLLLEQTFETPQEVVNKYVGLAERAGEVHDIRPAANGAVDVTLHLPDDDIQDVAQFVNRIFGNVSIHPNIRLIDFIPSSGLARRFEGPRLGAEGIREAFGFPPRPLTCTALKPVGLSADQLAELCRTFAESGIDIIKDDHYLSDQPTAPFKERIKRCADVAADVSARQGRPIWYVPSVSGSPDEVRRRCEATEDAGLRAVMLAPMTTGLPVLHSVRRDTDLAILTHPSFSPVASIAPKVLWSTLFRMLGADAVIFVNAGGRFDYSVEECRTVAATMMAPVFDLKASLPVPAGGIALDDVPHTIQRYGNDCALLVGGSLLKQKDLGAATRRFVEAVAKNALLAE